MEFLLLPGSVFGLAKNIMVFKRQCIRTYKRMQIKLHWDKRSKQVDLVLWKEDGSSAC